MNKIRPYIESTWLAIGALRTQGLRTFLSLLGVGIGIFCIISVLTIVGALEKSIRKSMSFLGENLVYVQKWPWTFEDDYPWWKYVKRPSVSEAEFRFLEKTISQNAGAAIFSIKGNQKLSYASFNSEKVNVEGVSEGFVHISDVRISAGRFFTAQEIRQGAPLCILGYDLQQQLFGSASGLNQIIRWKGKKLRVIATMQKQGANLLGAPSNDQLCLVPYSCFKQIYKVGKNGIEPMIGFKGLPQDLNQILLKDDLRMAMRTVRGLKPKQEDNFALNSPEMVSQLISSTFVIIRLAGWVMGGFSMLVGGFGIANIMFVSVKERTHLIGIQKALGAQKAYILWQFLMEAICIALLGALLGLALVLCLTFIPQEQLPLVLRQNDLLLGLGVAFGLGIVAGVVPAYQAANLDAVEAMRSGR